MGVKRANLWRKMVLEHVSAKISSKDTQLLLSAAFFFQKSKYVALNPIFEAPSCMLMNFCVHIGMPLVGPD